METKFIKAVFDIDCDWAGLPPVYRVYVNDELFTERTWIWADSYLEEILQIQAPPGNYTIKCHLVSPHLAKLTLTNFRVAYGPGIINDNILTITD